MNDVSRSEKQTLPMSVDPAIQELRDLLVQSIERSQEVYKQNANIQKNIKWMSIMSALRLIIFLIPIIAGIIFLPALLSNVREQYNFLFDLNSGIPDAGAFRTIIDTFGTE